MKNLILLLALILLASSCVTQRRCNRKFPPEVKTITNTETVIQYRDTVVYVTIPGDTVTAPGDTVYVDRVTGLANSEASVLHTSFARSWAQVVGGVLQHELVQKDSIWKAYLQNAIREKSTHTETVSETVREVNRLKWWQKVLMWTGGATTALFSYWVFRQFNLRG